MQKLAKITVILLIFTLLFTACGQASKSESAYGPLTEGEAMRDFTAELVNGDSFTLSDHKGKVILLNFWATWCGPCVKELPYFQQLADSYPHDVVVVPIHANLVTEDVSAWLTRNAYPTLPFALDETGEVLSGLGGSLMLPQTVIIDRQGSIVYNQVGSMTLEALMAQIQPLL